MHNIDGCYKHLTQLAEGNKRRCLNAYFGRKIPLVTALLDDTVLVTIILFACLISGFTDSRSSLIHITYRNKSAKMKAIILNLRNQNELRDVDRNGTIINL